MSTFLNQTPTVRIVVENSFFDKVYPPEGTAVAVIDTGYAGFLAIPRDIFQRLALDQLQLENRKLTLANGIPLTAEGALATFRVPDLSLKADGFTETYDGLEEIILGVEALTHFKILLDYCTNRLRLERCP